MKDSDTIRRAKELRANQTKAESLLWALLRSKQLSGLKFRRQHPIGPFYADFACVAKSLVVEIDGGYHDQTGQEDIARQTCLQRLGWRVIRFTNDDVLRDVEAVAIAITQQLGVKYDFSRKSPSGSHYSPPSPREG